MIGNTDQYTSFDRNAKSSSKPFPAVRITKVSRHNPLNAQSINKTSATLSNNKSISTIENARRLRDQSNKSTGTGWQKIPRSASTSKTLTHHIGSPILSLNSNQWNNDASSAQNVYSARSTPKFNTGQEHDFNMFSPFQHQPLERVKLPEFQNIIWGIHLSPYDTQSKRIMYMNENDPNESTKKRRKRKNSCPCSCLCIVISLVAAFIIASAVIATTVALSMVRSTTTLLMTTTTSVTTTTVTTSTTSSVTTSTTTTMYSCGNMTTWLDTDFVGFDIANAGGVSLVGCCSLCLANPSCLCFTYLIPASACYMKTTPTNNGSYSTTHISAKYL